MEQLGCKVVIGCIPDQGDSLHDTIPVLLPAALYADSVTVVTREGDTLLELSDYHPVLEHLGVNGQGVVSDIGADSWYSETNDAYMLQIEELREAASDRLRLLLHGKVDDILIENDPELRSIDHQIEMLEVQSVVSIVSELLTSPEALPLLYDPQGSLAKTALLGHQVLPTKLRRQAEAQFGTRLIAQLPTFENLNPAEIAELRRRLVEYLRPFRSYVVETSVGLVEAGSDETALQDVMRELYLGKVLPSVEELRRHVDDNKYLKRLLADFGKDPKKFVQSFLTFGVSEAIHLPLYVSIGGAITSQIISEATQHSRGANSLRGNRLFFLSEAERNIQKMHQTRRKFRR